MNGSKSVPFQQISENIKLPASDTYGCLFSMACTNFLRNLYFLTWFCPKSSRTTSLEKQPSAETWSRPHLNSAETCKSETFFQFYLIQMYWKAKDIDWNLYLTHLYWKVQNIEISILPKYSKKPKILKCSFLPKYIEKLLHSDRHLFNGFRKKGSTLSGHLHNEQYKSRSLIILIRGGIKK